VDSLKTKEVSQQVEDDATLCSPIGSVLFGISLDMTPGGDHIADLNVIHVEEKIDLIASKRTKENPQM